MTWAGSGSITKTADKNAQAMSILHPEHRQRVEEREDCRPRGRDDPPQGSLDDGLPGVLSPVEANGAGLRDARDRFSRERAAGER